ncbi:hypothetical protein ACA910_011347 [Epithemia clementina (nom. ined.)]
MDRPIFGAHPHAGFLAVTYMFEDLQGTFRNRWSKGSEQALIGPGSIHWTQAGSGMMHEEVPIDPLGTNKPSHGLQMFVKLPADQELSPPASFHLNANEVPVYQDNELGVCVRVLVGSYKDNESSIKTGNSGLTFLNVHLKPGATATFHHPSDQTAFIFNIHGKVTAPHSSSSNTNNDQEQEEVEIGEHAAAIFAPDGGDCIQLTNPSLDAPSEFLLCAGYPNKEPLISGGPFMMSTKERLDQAKEDYRNGKMGHLETSF